MNDKTKTWRSSTTTRSWSSTTDLTPEQRIDIEDLLDSKMDSVSVTEKWSYAGFENGEAFKVDIHNGAVTVNGRRYDSLDEVPRADRERIEALRSGQGMEGLWNMLKTAGIDVKDLGGDFGGDFGGKAAGNPAGRHGKPAFTIETEGSDAGHGIGRPDAITDVTPRSAPTHDTARPPNTGASLPPGAVPAGGGMRRMLLIGVAIGLALWVAQALNVF